MKQWRPILVTICTISLPPDRETEPHFLLCDAANSDYMAEDAKCLGRAHSNVSNLRHLESQWQDAVDRALGTQYHQKRGEHEMSADVRS